MAGRFRFGLFASGSKPCAPAACHAEFQPTFRTEPVTKVPSLLRNLTPPITRDYCGALHAEPIPARDPYFDTFEALKSQKGFLNDSRLIDANTRYPIQRGNLLPIRSLLGQSEVCGVRLGMSMSDVVRIWGKPNALVRFCRIGPRMYYCPGDARSDGISLFFRRNHLEIIEISGRRCEELIFDNGMTGKTPLSSIVNLLGKPQELPSGNLFYTGDLVDHGGRIRLDLCFQTPEPIAEDTLDAIAVRIVEEVDKGTPTKHTQESEAVPPNEP